ncbi:ATP-binding protein [Rhodosalinus sp. K401]|uniref:ATP-binding protein n=1 Tax=Rhodosalinus sp. K401 TaxID=3239195 RepID=UPI0035268CC0
MSAPPHVQASGGPSRTGDRRVVARCAARPADVRTALGRVMAGLAPHLGDCAGRTATELVLAEVLNNVVEHAHASDAPCAIRVEVRVREGRLDLSVSDDGRPMPGGRLPEGQFPSLAGPKATLPEGGFGWPLIHSLARDVRYRRRYGRNELRLALCLKAPGATTAPKTPQ